MQHADICWAAPFHNSIIVTSYTFLPDMKLGHPKVSTVKRETTSIPRAGFETAIPMFEMSRAVIIPKDRAVN